MILTQKHSCYLKDITKVYKILKIDEKDYFLSLLIILPLIIHARSVNDVKYGQDTVVFKESVFFHFDQCTKIEKEQIPKARFILERLLRDSLSNIIINGWADKFCNGSLNRFISYKRALK